MPSSKERTYLLDFVYLLLTAALVLALMVSLLAFSWVLRGKDWLSDVPGWKLGVLAVVLAFCIAVETLSVVDVRKSRRRVANLSLLPFRLGLDIVVLGTLVFVAFLQPFDYIAFVVSWGILGGVFALLVGQVFRSPRLFRSRLWGRIDFIVFNLCLALLCLEIGLRAIDRFYPLPILARNEQSIRRIERNRLTPESPHFGQRLNRRGYVDTEPNRPGVEDLVLVVGDSMSIGVVPHKYHYTTVAEEYLSGLEVYNAGIAGASPAEYLELLRQELNLLKPAPSAIVIALFLGNDIVEADVARRSVSATRLWFDRDNLLLYLLPRRLLRAHREYPNPTPAQSKESDTRASGGPEEFAPWLLNPFLEAPSFTEEAYLRLQSERAVLVCNRRRQDPYRGFFLYLEELVELAGETRIGFLMIPGEFQVEDQIWQSIYREAEESASLDRELPQKLVTEWISERGLPVLDLLPEFRNTDALSDGRKHLYHLRDTHLNTRGNRVTGEALADFLKGLR